ncbi:T9SS type A sorting domain-containing protein [Lewinella sp. W8]|uniref:T9SS type A sorting domain-containing protein n=1 Tax=Lewinella sp. W8 TaxID=2528208 RepID=UPI0010674835|nr:T9SS type A sorting domain-containing protein [Lewinella sp. W8]MTB50594.1 T9SS type A sorting domain-containing protein [Lewinella sp. W8]
MDFQNTWMDFRKVLLSLSTLLFALNINAQIINGNFDEWVIIDTAETYLDLIGWKTTNHNIFGGFKNVSVEKLNLDSANCQVVIESKQGTFDALISGSISQEISSDNLSSIRYKFKCDSLAGLGYCLVNITSEDMSMIFTDTIRNTSDSLISREVIIDSGVIGDSEKVNIYFEAYGYVFGLSPEMMAYSVFVLDDVSADYMTNTHAPINDEDIKVFPNPSGGLLRIDYPDNQSLNTIQIIDLNGKVLASYSGDTREIDVRNFSSGHYILRLIKEGRGLIARKFIIK